MKKFLLLFVFVLLAFLANDSSAITYLYFWVNGSHANVLTQGDLYAWDFDVHTPGSTVDVEIYLDLDVSHTLTGGDLMLQQFQLSDGGPGNDGPSDSSAVPNGNIYVNFGPFGFAAQNYLLRVVDTDESTVTNWFTVNAMSSPAAQIHGHVNVEGTSAPNALYQYVMVNAQGQGMFSGLTDNQGAYTINLPAANASWRVEAIFYPRLTTYILATNTYELMVPAAGVNNIDFNFSLGSAWIYGDLVDQLGSPVLINSWIGCTNTTLNERADGEIQNGHYNIPLHIVPQGDDSTNYFRIDIDNSGFAPNYLAPNLQTEFPVSMGDSIENDIVVYTTNSKIYGWITENSGPPSKSYMFFASSINFGNTSTLSSADDGYFELSVRTGDTYYVNLVDDPSYGTPLPEGYVIGSSNLGVTQVGDTIYVNLVPAQSALRGSISFEQGDPLNFDYDRNRINVWEQINNTNYGTRVNQNNTYNIAVLNGTYSVSFEPENNNYLALPAQYQNVSVDNDTIENLNFLLNYGHAQLTVKLVNAPIPQNWMYYNIQTEGTWPDVYSISKQLMPDSTIHFNICEGNWVLNAPFYDYYYDVFPQDTVLQVTEQENSFYVAFGYKLKTGIAGQDIVPQQLYLKQNYPNPFNPSTQIEYGLTQAGPVKLTVYNLLGQVIDVLIDSRQDAGIHRVSWQPSQLASGIYLYRLETEKTQITKKLVLVR